MSIAPLRGGTTFMLCCKPFSDAVSAMDTAVELSFRSFKALEEVVDASGKARTGVDSVGFAPGGLGDT
jgi:hypothetical protein